MEILQANTNISILWTIYITLIAIGFIFAYLQGSEEICVATIFGAVVFGIVMLIVSTTQICKRSQGVVIGRVSKTDCAGVVIIGDQNFPIQNIGFYNAVTNGDNKMTLVKSYAYFGNETKELVK